LEAAADSGGSTIHVITDLAQAPKAGMALSTSAGEGAGALSGQASGGLRFTADIPKALVDLMKSKGLAVESRTMMGGVSGTELKFSPQATEFVVRYFNQVR
jgi:hypothetical protein